MMRAAIALALLILLTAACGQEQPGSERGARPERGGSRAGGPGGPGGTAAVPVETVTVERRSIASYVETNGVLEAENEVDVVARTSGPIVELLVEEGDRVTRGQPLARLDSVEPRAQLEIARVTLNEMRLAYERAESLQREQLISPESFEQAQSNYETAAAQVEASRILLDYTEITAPFSGLVVRRYVNFAEQLTANTPLFRISDFDPLLCPIQVPERELSNLRVRQPAYLTVESFPGERFESSVLRIRPVIDSATGTVRVTLAVRNRGRLRPGMFARAFVEVETHDDALVVPKVALSLESIGDTVYVAQGEVAARREVTLGFNEGDSVEVLSGVAEGESVIVVGQDGLSEGTPIQVLASAARERAALPRASASAESSAERSAVPPVEPSAAPSVEPSAASAATPPADRPETPTESGRRERGRGSFLDPSTLTPEQLERFKESMRARGMTEQQIEERLKRARERAGSNAP